MCVCMNAFGQPSEHHLCTGTVLSMTIDRSNDHIRHQSISWVLVIVGHSLHVRSPSVELQIFFI